jgi:plasmid maintenance system killer protein
MWLLIVGFADRETERLYVTGKSRRFPATVFKSALRKLDYLNRSKLLTPRVNKCIDKWPSDAYNVQNDKAQERNERRAAHGQEAWQSARASSETTSYRAQSGQQVIGFTKPAPGPLP